MTGNRALRTLAPALVALVAMFAVACGSDGSIEDGREVVLADKIEFTIPGSMEDRGVSGFDSIVGSWESATLWLLLNYGANSDPLGYTSKEGYSVTIATIDGKSAIIERFMDASADANRPYVTAIHIADDGEGQKLTIFGRAATEEEQDMLLDVYKTLNWL